MKTDVVIIGAGIAGLATGALLAKQGKRVVLLEKGNAIAGRAYCYEEKGFTLNYGPHGEYIPESGPLTDLMARLGRQAPRCGYPSPARSFWAQGDRYGTISSNPAKLLTTPLFSLSSRMNFVKLMLTIRNEKPDRLSDDLTWGQWIASKTEDDTLRRFMMSFATINSYTARAEDLSAKWFIAHAQRTLFSKDYVGYMHGGWKSKYGAWVEEIEANGGVIVTGTRVDGLDVQSGRILAALTPGESYEADAFICTLTPQDTPAIAAADTPLHRELTQWTALDEVRAYCIDLGFDRRVRDDVSLIYDVDHDLYLSIHSETAPDLAPPGCQMLHAMAYLTPEEAADDTLGDRRRQELHDGLDRYFPGWHEAAVVRRTLNNAKVLGARRTPENIKNLVPLRASSVENLYFANDARDLNYNLSQVCLVAAMEVADAIAALPAKQSQAAVAV